MKVELNYREYTHTICLKYPKCSTCAWEHLLEQYCTKFCRKGYIFKTIRIVPSIFHL